MDVFKQDTNPVDVVNIEDAIAKWNHETLIWFQSGVHRGFLKGTNKVCSRKVFEDQV